MHVCRPSARKHLFRPPVLTKRPPSFRFSFFFFSGSPPEQLLQQHQTAVASLFVTWSSCLLLSPDRLLCSMAIGRRGWKRGSRVRAPRAAIRKATSLRRRRRIRYNNCPFWSVCGFGASQLDSIVRTLCELTPGLCCCWWWCTKCDSYSHLLCCCQTRRLPAGLCLRLTLQVAFASSSRISVPGVSASSGGGVLFIEFAHLGARQIISSAVTVVPSVPLSEVVVQDTWCTIYYYNTHSLCYVSNYNNNRSACRCFLCAVPFYRF